MVKGNEGLAPGRVISVTRCVLPVARTPWWSRVGQRNDNGRVPGGPQLANELGLVDGSALRGAESGRTPRRTRVLILGVNGFIGNHLSERLLRDDRYEVYGLDIGSDAIDRLRSHPNFHLRRRRHQHPHRVDRIPHQEVRRGPAAGGHRHADRIHP